MLNELLEELAARVHYLAMMVQGTGYPLPPLQQEQDPWKTIDPSEKIQQKEAPGTTEFTNQLQILNILLLFVSAVITDIFKPAPTLAQRAKLTADKSVFSVDYIKRNGAAEIDTLVTKVNTDIQAKAPNVLSQMDTDGTIKELFDSNIQQYTYYTKAVLDTVIEQIKKDQTSASITSTQCTKRRRAILNFGYKYTNNTFTLKTCSITLENKGTTQITPIFTVGSNLVNDSSIRASPAATTASVQPLPTQPGYPPATAYPSSLPPQPTPQAQYTPPQLIPQQQYPPQQYQQQPNSMQQPPQQYPQQQNYMQQPPQQYPQQQNYMQQPPQQYPQQQYPVPTPPPAPSAIPLQHVVTAQRILQEAQHSLPASETDEQLRAEKEQLKQTHQREQDELAAKHKEAEEQKRAELKKEKEAHKLEHEAAQEKLKQQHDAEALAAKNKAKEEKIEQAAAHQKQRDDLNAKHAAELLQEHDAEKRHALEEEHKAAHAKLQHEHEQAAAVTKAKHDQEKQKLEAQHKEAAEQQKAKHEREAAAQSEKRKQIKHELEVKHAHEIQAKQADHQKATAAAKATRNKAKR